MNLKDWHGFRLLESDRTFYVGRLPGRKSVALYVLDGNVVDVLAYFRSEEHAREALSLFDELMSS